MRNILLALLLLFTASGTLADTELAKAAADQHYALAKASDQAAWAATFNKSDYQLYQSAMENGVKGHVLDSPWRSAQRRVVQGITWKYERTDQESAEECKFFYERLKPNGEREGFTVPIRLKLEDGKWVVVGVSY